MNTKHVIVKKYDPKWKDAFFDIQTYLYQEVPKKFKIEHVGSTSVVGLSAKPVIDIDIPYNDDQEKALLIDKLAKLGYVHEGNLGVPDREAFEYNDIPYMKHHLYVIKKESVSYRDHVLLRDYLSVHELERNTYGDLKMSLAEQYPFNIDAYCEGKAPYIEEILEKAVKWDKAKQSNLIY